MALTFCSFSSGSSGNCYLVKSDKTALLIDAGISGRRILESLKRVRVDPADVKAVLITHEHSDHIKSLKTVSRKLTHAVTYANIGTWENINGLVDDKRSIVFKTGEEFFVGDIKVKAFHILHDASEPVGYSFSRGESRISILTDTGRLNDEIYEEIKEADLLVLEANHDVEMLRVGRYPWFLKQRILGEKGHLSNVDAAGAICRLLSFGEKNRRVLLAHLSRENNFPEMAYQTVKNLLEENNYYINKNVCVNIIERDEMSALFTV